LITPSIDRWKAPAAKKPVLVDSPARACPLKATNKKTTDNAEPNNLLLIKSPPPMDLSRRTYVSKQREVIVISD
jgi:hypothetical protein